MAIYDAVVLGTGGVGSAARCHLAQQGARVLGVDRFAPPHDQGSSHGQTRIIRQAYFEHPDYTPLLLESYRLWNELEEQVSRQLYHEVGVLQVGPADGVVVPGVLRAAELHGLQVEQLTATQIERRWPGLSVPEHLSGVLETRAGFLKVEECVQSHLDAAKHAGAELHCPVEVQGWEGSDPIRLQTSEGEILTKRLVVTAGAWAGELLAAVGVEFEIRRKSLFWYATETDSYAVENGFPGFLFELPSGVFYGFPQIDEQGLKLADHAGGKPITDPLQVDRDIDKEEQQQIETFLREFFPQVRMQCTHHAACMYTMTPDEHFVVDRQPQHKNVFFAAGLSGHGFKFASVLGKVLADMALDGGTELAIDFLSLQRFEPGYSE
jgi:sarcosine oxidase